MDFPYCAECRVRVRPGDNVMFRVDGRVQHAACPKVSCFACGREVKPGTPIRRYGEELVHSNCWRRVSTPDSAGRLGITPRGLTATTGGDSDGVGEPFDLAAGGLAGLIMSIKPVALCDSCIALNVRVSLAQAHEASVSLAKSAVFERTRQRCHLCGRTVEAIGAR